MKNRRRLKFESLEGRRLLAADWTNSVNHLDVNQSGMVTALDALLILNEVNSKGAHVLPDLADGTVPPAWLDVNADNVVSALDALQIINAINANPDQPTLSFVNSSTESPGTAFTGRTTPNAKVVVEQMAAILPAHWEFTADANGEFTGVDVGGLGMLVKAKVTDPLGRTLVQNFQFAPGAAAAELASLDENAGPTIGQVAPEVKLQNQNGVEVSLSNALKNGTVVLYFYPKDNTPKCTVQAQDLRNRSAEIQSLGATILGVSVDPVDSHLEFADKYDLNFDILSDVTHAVSEAYGVLTELNGRPIALRTTFIIGSDGVIKEIFRDVNADVHSERVVEALRNL